MIPSLARPYCPVGYQMIHDIEIRNFRCFQNFEIKGCRRFNIVVGENGVGKTALLEALFLTLAGSVEVGFRLKQQRGFDTAYSGAPRAIEAAIWKDYFYKLDWNKPISIALDGSGRDSRSLVISRGSAEETLIPFDDSDQPIAPLQFVWKDSVGKEYTALPKITGGGIQAPPSEEYLPDFFLFAANHVITSSENAARFSELSVESRERAFVEVFTHEYPWIKDLSIEVSGGFPMIHATLQGEKRKLPINAISGGINRIISIMLAIASRPRSVILVDEIENGVYYKHKVPLWRGLLSLARTHDSQLFLSTHDEEWLEALVEDSGDNIDDLALWRIERQKDGARIMRQFPRKVLKAGIETGGEVR